jgi:hypothetical protein
VSADSLPGLRFRFAIVWLCGSVYVLRLEEKLKLETFFLQGLTWLGDTLGCIT